VIKEVRIRNTKTGNVRVIDYHVDHPDDPPLLRAFHDKHKPRPHVVIDVGPDEVIEE
jgi:hypothetical protein